jgi:hypothetical protein
MPISKDGRIFCESSGSYDCREARNCLAGRYRYRPLRRTEPERIKFSESAQLIVDAYKANARASLDDLETLLRMHLLPAFGDIRAADFGTAI